MNTVTIRIYNRNDVFVKEYESIAVPNVGEEVCLFLGGVDNRYCKGKVTKRLFGENCVVITLDSDDKPLSRYEIEADRDLWLDDEDDQ